MSGVILRTRVNTLPLNSLVGILWFATQRCSSLKSITNLGSLQNRNFLTLSFFLHLLADILLEKDAFIFSFFLFLSF